MRTLASLSLMSIAVGSLACSSGGGAEATVDGGSKPDATHPDASAPDAGRDAHTKEAAPPDAAIGTGVFQHHGDGTRAGVYVDPAFTKEAVVGLEPLPGFSFTFPPLLIGGSAGTEQVFAQVLFASKVVQGADALFVATESDNVYAVNADTGAKLWKTSLGTAAGAQYFPSGCGSIYPLGVTGTPVIDAASGTLYVVAMTVTAGAADYVVHALSVSDGSSKWTLDLNATIPGFNSSVEMQRGALTLVNGVLYFPFGALAGACGSPYAWVVAVPVASPMQVKAWRPKTIGAGIWGPSGVATDGTSVYVGTSENTAPSEPPSWALGNSEAVLRISAGGSGPAFSGATTDFFTPADWFAQDQGGGQIGSSGVVLFDQPASTPSTLAFAVGKTVNAALLDRTNLGGIGGQIASLPSATADWVEGAMSAYSTTESTYVALGAGGLSCPAGSDLSTVRVVPGSPPSLARGWCAKQGGHGAPMVTVSSLTASGGTDAIVWGLGTNHQGTSGTGELTAFDGDTGAVLVQSTTTMGDLEHWISPIAVNGRLYFAGDHGIYAFDLDGAAHPADAGPTVAPVDAGLPASCFLTVSALQIDRCAAFGLTCQGNAQQSELGTCATPLEGSPCKPSVGCATGLVCQAAPAVDGGAASYQCVAPCNATTACGNLSEACSSTGADAGYCAFVTCGGGGDAGTYFGACSNHGSSGTCLPLYTSNGSQVGSCVQAGTADTGSCATARSVGAAYCRTGEYCLQVNGSACLSLCNFAATQGYVDGGPTCPAGQVCTAAFGSESPSGLCAQPCGGDAGATCTGSFSCLEWNGSTGASACFP